MPFPFAHRPSVGPGRISRPAPKQQAVKPKPTFLGGGRFRKTDELMTEIKKHSYYRNIPTYGKKPSQKERIDFIKTLQKASGATGGLSKTRLRQAIKKMEKQKLQAGCNRQYKEVKRLDQQIKQAKILDKTW